MARGIYDRTAVKKVVVLEKVIKDFKEFARQASPDFNCTEATKQRIWNTHRGRKLGLTFNTVKKLAGLPVKYDRKNDGKTTMAASQYVKKLCHGNASGKAAYHDKTKSCLGILPNESYCSKKVSKGQYFCETCRERINKI